MSLWAALGRAGAGEVAVLRTVLEVCLCRAEEAAQGGQPFPALLASTIQVLFVLFRRKLMTVVWLQ